MNLLKSILLVMILLSLVILVGCEAEYARRPESELGRRKIYQPRADGVHTPAYSYSR